MTELTINTGLQGDRATLHIDWFDENGAHHSETPEINIDTIDKPRTLVLVINKKVLANITAQGMCLQ